MKYNLSQRKPVVLECGDQLCESCLKSLVMPQDPEHFKCPFDEEELDFPKRFLYNKQLLKQLEKISGNDDKLCILCVVHEDRECGFTCSKENKMLCSDCLFDHFDHKDKITKIEWDQVRIKLQEKLNTIEKMQYDVSVGAKWIRDITTNDLILNSSDYEQTYAKISKLTDIIELALSDKEQNIEGQNDNINQKIKSESPQIQVKRQGFLSESQILSKDGEFDYVKSLFKDSKPYSKLLYRGTTDGMYCHIFHAKCDNKGPTVTLVKSHHGKIMGGFTEISWTCPSEQKLLFDKRAFVFSVTHKTKHPVAQIVGYSITHDPEYLPVFCGGFGISSNCKISMRSNIGISNLGAIYSCPPGMKYLEPQTQAYLGGSYEFIVDEIEVFSVYN
ncbi:UNKNOWN [Stylonychia lemnae]|uniref:TLDc domain-containing protein n=1 Tax=Stylonychia lemnae TaxID=5949 RepID=A0A078AKU7_STYLE|nr:UNKNOWN [Stylonychia lemnae]|eukprot:CDW81428.1 UNKNOWN [Stylonychia lemnae]